MFRGDLSDKMKFEQSPEGTERERATPMSGERAFSAERIAWAKARRPEDPSTEEIGPCCRPLKEFGVLAC